MGSSSSKDTKNEPRLKNIFSKELETISDILQHVLTSDNKFVNDEYNFLSRDTCQRYTFVLESNLKKHLKIDVQELHDSLILIPKQTRVAVGDKVIDKNDLCDIISKHYIKLLYILCLVKYVYDLENGGDFSLAGIVSRNIRMVGNLLEINYCALPQKDYSKSDKKIDFNSLKGMKFFLEYFVNPEEKHIFLDQLKMIFARKIDHKKLADIVCHDNLLTQKEYESLYQRKFVCKTSNKKLAVNERDTTLFEVQEFNPILSSELCMSKKKLIVQVGSDKKSKEIRRYYDDMLQHYRSNLENIKSMINNLIQKQGSSYTLKHISDDDLTDIIRDIKKIIIRFYIISILDYQNLLDLAKTMPMIRLDL
jgi:hypothetical protein